MMKKKAVLKKEEEEDIWWNGGANQAERSYGGNKGVERGVAEEQDTECGEERGKGYLDDEDDEILEELDVVVPESSFLETIIPMVLQFPLRRMDAPYVGGEGEPKVRYKRAVKRLHWEIPLDTQHECYFDGENEDTKIKSLVLKSSLVDPDMATMAVGFVQDGKMHMIPVKQVMQMRPSLQHLDERKGGENILSQNLSRHMKKEIMQELQPITVQIKKHETEQQTEARMRSYAFHAQKDEADTWAPLTYCSSESAQAQAMMTWMGAGKQEVEESILAVQCEEYLDAIVPGLEVSGTLEHPVAVQEDGNDAQINDVGKPATSLRKIASVSAPAIDGNAGKNDLSYESSRALKGAMDRLFEQSAVLSTNRIRKSLQQQHMPQQLKSLGASGSDDDIHACVVSAGEFMFIRHGYVRRIHGDSILDPLRSVVLDVLSQNEVVKRGDIFELAQQRGVAVTDTMYSRVMKELCTSKGSSWSMKTGD